MSLIFKPLENECTVYPILTQKKYIPPNIYISTKALLKMKSFIDNTNEEIAWLGTVINEENKYTITDVELFEQTTTSVTAEITEESLSKYANKLINEKRFDDLNNIRVWGHSHVNMAVNPSGTDDATFKYYYEKCGYFIRLIGNKKGDMRIDIALPNENIMFTNVKWQALPPSELAEIQKEKEWLQKQILELEQKIDNWYEKEYKQYETNAKVIIPQNIKKNKSAWKTNNWNNKWVNSYDNYGYYDYYDYYDYYSNEQECEFLYPVKDGANVCELNDIFSENDIKFLAESTLEEIKTMLKNEMGGYTDEDWLNLHNQAIEYYCDMEGENYNDNELYKTNGAN